MQRGPVEVTALDQDNKRVLSTGEGLLLIDNAIDQVDSATLRLHDVLANKRRAAVAGGVRECARSLGQRRDVVAVPTECDPARREPVSTYGWSMPKCILPSRGPVLVFGPGRVI